MPATSAPSSDSVSLRLRLISVLSSLQTLTRWLILLKARRQVCATHTLRPVVSTQFQILFHSPRRGSFHLSLTVLLRYRSVRVFSLGGWSPLLPTMLASIVVLRIIASMLRFRLRDSHPLWRNFPNASASLRIPSRESCNPVSPKRHGLGSSAFARHYSQNLLLSSSYLDVSVRTVPLLYIQDDAV